MKVVVASYIIRAQTTNVFVLPQLGPIREKQKWHYWTRFFIFCKENAFNFKSKKVSLENTVVSYKSENSEPA